MAARMSHNMRNLFECGRLMLQSCLSVCVLRLLCIFVGHEGIFRATSWVSKANKSHRRVHTQWKRDEDAAAAAAAAAASTKVSQLQKYIHTHIAHIHIHINITYTYVYVYSSYIFYLAWGMPPDAKPSDLCPSCPHSVCLSLHFSVSFTHVSHSDDCCLCNRKYGKKCNAKTFSVAFSPSSSSGISSGISISVVIVFVFVFAICLAVTAPTILLLSTLTYPP